MSSVDGTVTYTGKNGGYGNLIEVKRKDGLTVRYAHLNKINTVIGNKVKIGDKNRRGRKYRSKYRFSSSF